MAIKNPFDKLTKGAEESAEVTKQYTESEIKEIGKLNDKRLKDTQKTISSLKSSEEKLAANIVNINKKLIQDLSKIADDRFNMNQDIQTRIAELERGGMSDDAAYYDRQKDAAKALADAKVALKEGEYEKYKSYLSEYESLITSSAGQEIKVNDRIAVSAEETRKRAIEGLKKIQSLENAYYDKKKSDAQTAHDLALQQSEIELSSIEAQLEAQKALLVVVKELTEAITGKTIDLDSSAIDAAIAKVKKAKEGLKTLSITPAKVTVDSRDVDVSKEKVEELKTLMINGVELEVKADTTPASFGIDKLITKVDGDEISMDVNPRYEAAQRELEAFRNGENSKPIEKTVEVDTDTPKQKMDLLVTDMEKPTTSTHTVDDNIEEVVSELSKMGEATTSTHTVDDNVPEVISDISTMKEPTTSTHTVTDNVPEVLSDIDEMKEDTDSTHTVEGNVEEIISELSTMENDTTSTHTVDDNVPDVLSDIVKMKKPTTSKHTVDDNVPQVLSAINRMKQSTGSRHTIDDNVPQVLREINKLKRTTHSNHIVHEKIIRARAGGGPIQHLAEGGLAFKRLVGKIPGHDTTGRDDVPIMGTRGEFMHPVSTVDHYGLSVMEKMRRKLIPKEVFNGYATGGLIKAGAFHPPKMPQHLASGGVVGASSAYSVSPALGDLGTLTLKVGGNDLQVLAPRDVAAALTTFINSEGGL